MTIVNRQSPIAAAIQLTWPARWGANSVVNSAIYPLDFSEAAASGNSRVFFILTIWQHCQQSDNLSIIDN